MLKDDEKEILDDIGAFIDIADQYVLEEEYKKAIEQYSTTIDNCKAVLEKASSERREYVNEFLYKMYNNRGISYSALKLQNKAISDYNKAIEINSDDSRAYYNRGVSFVLLKKHDEAIVDFSKVIEYNPNNSNAFYNRGASYSALKKHDEAIVDFSKVIKYNPNDSEANYNRGNSYLKLKKHDEAIVDFSKVIEIKSNNFKAYNNRGVSYLNLEKYNEAIEDFSKAIKYNPDDSKAYSYYNLGNSYFKLKWYAEAIANFNETINRQPNNISAYFIRGNSHFTLRKYKNAIEDYSKVIELDNSNQYNLKRIYFIKKFNKLINKYSNYKINFFKIAELVFRFEKKIEELLSTNKYNRFSHYSKPPILKNLLNFEDKDKTDTKLRLYLIDNMNDPEEGKFFNKNNKNIKFFTDENEDTHFCFVACFVAEDIVKKEDQNEAVNSLNLWRNYAKGDDREEAAGVKIVLPTEFFSLNIESRRFQNMVNIEPLLNDTISINQNKNNNYVETQKSNDNINIQGSILTNFYKVQYGVDGIKKFNKEIFKLLKDFEREIDNIKKNKKLSKVNRVDIEKQLKSCVRIMTIELKYLFKSAFYKSEEECRLIAIIPKSSFYIKPKRSPIKIDKKSNKLYIEINNDLFSQPDTKIFLGTTMKDAEIQKPKLEHNLAKLGNNNCTVSISKLPFRVIEQSTNRNEIDIKATLYKPADYKDIEQPTSHIDNNS